MASSVQPDEQGSRRTFRLKVVTTLIAQAHVLDIDCNDLIEFFAVQASEMLNHKPNIKMGTTRRIWVMRGFYPGSTLFFKLSLIDGAIDVAGSELYAKASPLHIGVPKKGFALHNMFEGDKIHEVLTKKMENSFFNADHDIEPLIKDKQRLPRCMSPKGMKIYRLDDLARGKMSKLLALSLLFVSAAALADGASSSLNSQPIFFSLLGNDYKYREASFKAQEAFFAQTGVSTAVDKTSNYFLSESNNKVTKFINDETPFSATDIFFLFGMAYAAGVKKQITRKFKDPLFVGVTHTVSIGQDSSVLGTQFRF